MTPAERKAAERQRRKDAGLVRCEVWVKPEHVAEVRAFADDLRPYPQDGLPSAADVRGIFETYRGILIRP